MRLQKLSLWGNGKAIECWQIHICLSIFNNLKTTSRLGHLVSHKYTRNINKWSNLAKQREEVKLNQWDFDTWTNCEGNLNSNKKWEIQNWLNLS